MMAMLNIKDFKLLHIIGTGSSSRVFKTQHNGKIYALKAGEKDKAVLDTAGVNEKNIWKRLNHPFLTDMLACFKTSNHLCYLMEYTPGGDMVNMVEFYHGQVPEKYTRFYAAELSLAVDYLHSIGIVHRDIKPKNILIAADGHVKLTDFDIAADLRKEGKTNTFCGTVNFMAPEIAEKKIHGYEVDWWSFGATLYFMLHGYPPAQQKVNKKEASTGEELSQSEIKFAARISKIAIIVLKGFLTENPNNRLGKAGLLEIKSHKFFKEIDWEKLEEKKIEPPFVPSLHNLPNISEKLLSENFSLSADYHIFKQHENVSYKSNREKHFRDFYYINPNWEK